MTTASVSRPPSQAGRPPGSAATLITVAPTGAELDKEKVPALPVTLDELVTTAVDCEAAGAAVIHIHIRDAGAQPTLDLARLKDTVQAVREATSLISSCPPAARSAMGSARGWPCSTRRPTPAR
jgi:uncharacterized protein (DUF849 family)